MGHVGLTHLFNESEYVVHNKCLCCIGLTQIEWNALIAGQGRRNIESFCSLLSEF